MNIKKMKILIASLLSFITLATVGAVGVSFAVKENHNAIPTYAADAGAVSTDTKLKYISNGDGTCSVQQISPEVTIGSIEIPTKSPDGDTVTTIKEDSFIGCSGLTALYIASTITDIQISETTPLFYGCDNLMTIRVRGSGVTSGGVTYPFSDTDHAVGTSNDTMNAIIRISDKTMIAGCKGTKFKTPYGSTLNIAPRLFYNCDWFTNVELSSIGTIGEEAFYGCSKLESVTSTVSTIGKGAFKNCTSLKTITAKENNIAEEVFYGCTSLTEYSYAIDTVGVRGFYGCSSLIQLNQGSFSNTTFGEEAFYGCTSLTNLKSTFRGYDGIEQTFEDGVLIAQNATIGNRAFYGTKIKKVISREFAFTDSWDSGHLYLSSESFANMPELTDLKIKKSVRMTEGETVTENMFKTSNKLTNVYFSEIKFNILDNMFKGLTNLSQFIIYEGEYSIGENAFAGCINLKELVLGEYYNSNYTNDNVTSFPENAISGCSKIEKFTISLDKTKNISISSTLFQNNTNLTNLTISGATEIDANAFSGCVALTDISLSDIGTLGADAFNGCPITNLSISNIGVIGDSAFKDFVGLETLDLSTTTQIGINAFQGWTNLKSINLSSIETIGANAFSGCTSLESITLSSVLSSVGENAFLNTTIKTISSSGLSVYFYTNATSADALGGLIKNAERIEWISSSIIDANENTYLNNNDNFIKYIYQYSEGQQYFYLKPEYYILEVEDVTIEYNKTIEYDGTPRIPTIVVTDTARGEVLVEGTHYTIECSNNVNANKYVYGTIKGIGNTTGSRSIQFEITPIKLNNADITATLSQTEYEYDGTEKKPTVTVTHSTMMDITNLCTITYPNMIWPGTKTIRIELLGNYSADPIELTYVITGTVPGHDITQSPLSISVYPSGSTSFTGSEIRPSVTISNPNETRLERMDGTPTGGTGSGMYNYYYHDPVHGQNYVYNQMYNCWTDQYSDPMMGGQSWYSEDDLKAAFSLELTKGTDFEVVITSGPLTDGKIINVGTYTYIVRGINAYYGEKEYTLTITAKPFSDFLLSLDDWYNDYSWNISYLLEIEDIPEQGGGATPVPKIKFVSGYIQEGGYDSEGNYVSGKQWSSIVSEFYLKHGVDFTTSYRDNTSAGEATCVITGIGNYSGSIERKFTVTTVDINSEQITLDEIPNQIYTGSAITPTLTIKNTNVTPSTVLVLGTDYTVSYTPNVNVGQVTITITGTGSYSGTRTATFQIVPKNFSSTDITINVPANITYTGNAIRPEITLYDGENVIPASAYTIDYSNNVNAGTARVVVTAIEGNYTGTKATTFNISKLNIADANITLSFSEIAFDGQNHLPSVTVKVGEKTLTLGEDYTITYQNALLNEIEEAIQVGEYKVFVQGINNCELTKTLDFHITPASINDATITLSQSTFTYNATSQRPVVTVQIGGLTIDSSNYTTTIHKGSIDGDVVTDCVDAATYYIVVSTNSSSYQGTKDVSFVINPLDITHAVVTVENIDLTYDGQPKQPEVTSVVMGGVTVTDLSTVYSENLVNAGTKQITITSTSTNFTGTLTYTYEVKQRNIDLSTISGIVTKTYNRNAQTQNVILTDSGLGRDLVSSEFTVSYEDNVDAGTASINIRGIGNFTGERTETFTILKAQITEFTLTADSVTFNRNAQVPTVASVLAGELSLNNTEYRFETYRGETITTDYINAGEIVVKLISTSENFELPSDGLSRTYTINKATLSEVTLQEINTTYNGSEQRPVITGVNAGSLALIYEDSTDGVKEYALSYKAVDGATNTDFTNAHIINVIATAANDNFTGSVEIEYEIFAKNIQDANVEVHYYFVDADGNYVDQNNETTNTPVELVGDQIYFGQRVKPVFTYNVNETTHIELVLGTDYEVVARGTKNQEEYDYKTVDNFTLTSTGAGNYKGEIVELYNVNSAEFNETNIKIHFNEESREKYLYTGEQVTINPIVDITATYTDKGETENLVYGRDYVLYSGTATIDSADSGIEGESGTTTIEVLNGYWIERDGDTIIYKNINAGTAMVFFEGLGNYATTEEGKRPYICVHFPINPATAEGVELELEQTEFTFTGSEFTPTETVTWKGRTLVNGTDYTISYANNKDASTEELKASATIEGKNNFKFTISKEFNIAPRTLSDEMLSADKTATYNGAEQEPNIVLTYNAMKLVLGTDYQLSFMRGQEVTTDFTNAGTVTITITGIGNYTDEISFNYVIEKLGVKDVVLDPSSATYTGSAHTIVVKVVDVNDNVVDAGEYVVTIATDADLTNVGTVSVNVAAKANSNYNIPTTDLTYTITKRVITASDVSNIPEQGYTGSQITPVVTIVINEKTLELGKDYTVSYGENIHQGENAGVVTIVGQGNFSGNFDVNFTIGKTSLENDTITIDAVEDVDYDGEEHKLAPKIYFNSTQLFGEDYSLTYERDGVETTDFTSAGTITIVFKATEAGNFSGETSVEYTINQRNLSTATITLDSSADFTYTGSEIKPSVTNVNLGLLALTLDVDYEVAYSDNINAGTASVSLTGKGNFTGTATVNFTIVARTLTENMLSGLNASYDYTGNNIIPSVVLTYNTNTLTINDDYTITCLDNLNAGTATLTITGKGNYTGEITKNFTINKLSFNDTNNTVTIHGIKNGDQFVYTGSDVIVNLGIKVSVNSIDQATFSISNATTNEQAFIAVGPYTIKLTGNGNFSGELTVSFEIIAKAIEDSWVSIPKDSYEYTGSDIFPTVTVKNGETTLYNNTDYTITYKRGEVITSDLTSVGEVRIVITGKGNYTGTVTNLTFTITRIMPKPTISLSSKLYYEGDEITDVEIVLVNDFAYPYYEFKIVNTEDTYLTLGEKVYDYTFTVLNADREIDPNYEVYEGKIAITTHKLEIVSVELVNKEGVKTTYDAYEVFDPTTLKVRLVYNNGTKSEIINVATKEGTEIKFADGFKLSRNSIGTLDVPEILTVGSVNRLFIFYTFEDEQGNEKSVFNGELVLTINTRKISLDFSDNDLDNLLSGNDIDLVVDIVASDEVLELIETYRVNLIKTYTLNGNTTTPNEAGRYLLTVSLDNNNYEIVGKNTQEFYVRPVQIKSVTGNIYVTSENGFDEEVKLDILEITNVAEMEQYIGQSYNEVGNIDRLYVISVVTRDGTAYTGEYKVYVREGFADGKILYKYENGRLVQILDGELTDGYLLICNTKADLAVLTWVLVGIAATVVIVTTILTISGVRRRNKRKKLIERINEEAKLNTAEKTEKVEKTSKTEKTDNKVEKSDKKAGKSDKK